MGVAILARTMLMDPDVIVMDEPTSSLDMPREKALLKTLREQCGEKILLIFPSTFYSYRMYTRCTAKWMRLRGGADEEDRKISKKMLQQSFAGASSYYVMPRSARLLAALLCRKPRAFELGQRYLPALRE